MLNWTYATGGHDAHNSMNKMQRCAHTQRVYSFIFMCTCMQLARFDALCTVYKKKIAIISN